MADVNYFRASAFSENTKKTYRSQVRSYLRFCELMDMSPAPISKETASLYAAHLAKRLLPVSIRQYMNVVRLIHLESGFPNPCEDNWFLKSTLAGIERIKGNPVNRKAPVSPELLVRLYGLLDFSHIFDSMFWAAAVVMFFCTC